MLNATSSAITNPLAALRREIQAGHVQGRLAEKAELLVSTLQTEVLELSTKARNGEYHCNPVWSDSSHRTNLSFDVLTPPTAENPVAGVSSFEDRASQSGKWGWSQSRTIKSVEDGLLFSVESDGRKGVSVMFNKNGTLTVNAGERLPMVSNCPGTYEV